jgi:hypothetical protein
MSFIYRAIACLYFKVPPPYKVVVVVVGREGGGGGGREKHLPKSHFSMGPGTYPQSAALHPIPFTQLNYFILRKHSCVKTAQEAFR